MPELNKNNQQPIAFKSTSHAASDRFALTREIVSLRPAVAAFVTARVHTEFILFRRLGNLM